VEFFLGQLLPPTPSEAGDGDAEKRKGARFRHSSSSSNRQLRIINRVPIPSVRNIDIQQDRVCARQQTNRHGKIKRSDLLKIVGRIIGCKLSDICAIKKASQGPRASAMPAVLTSRTALGEIDLPGITPMGLVQGRAQAPRIARHHDQKIRLATWTNAHIKILSHRRRPVPMAELGPGLRREDKEGA